MGMGSRSVLLFNRVGSGGAAVLPHHPAYSRTNSFKQAEVIFFSIYFIASVRKERNDKSFYGGRLFFYYFAFRILE